MSWLDQFFQTGYKTLAIGGVALANETVLNLVSGASAVDNPGLGRTDVTITGAATVVVWQDGTDAAFTITGTTGQQNITIPALTASRTWKFPANPTDGMRVKLCDLLGHYVTASGSGWAISVQGNAGTEHVFAEGADKGTLYAVPVALLGNGSVAFEYRASNTSWNMV